MQTNKSNIYIFFVLCFIVSLINFYSQTYLITDDLYLMVIGGQMTIRQFEDYLLLLRKWQWVGYIAIPIALLLRISFSWFCFKSGSFLTDSFTEVPFWNICIQAELVFIIGAVVTLLYNEFFVDIQSLEQLSTNPFSLNVFAGENFPSWGKYFLNTLNAFEVFYVISLAYLIGTESRKPFRESFKFVSITYLPGLALWIMLVSYLSIFFQP